MHPRGADRSAYLNDLAGALWERYLRGGNLDDLNESIEILGDALTHCSPGHPLRAETLNNLAICLRDRHTEQHTSSSDLDQAIKTQEAALALRPEGHPDRSSSLTNLSLCLRDRFQEKGSADDLDGAVVCSRAALALRPKGHHFRPSCLSNLAIALQYRYELHDTLVDLQESIQLLRDALESYPPSHSERPVAQFNLSLGLRGKFRRDGTIVDLNEAIDLLRPLKERGSLRNAIWLSYINALANCLKERFWHLGTPADFNEAILLHAIAVEVCPHDHSERSMFFNNLGNSFEERFSLRGHLGDLEKAIGYHQAALDLRPSGHSDRSSSLNNLGDCHKQRFVRLNESDDLSKAIEFITAALELRPEGHLRRPTSLHSLADCLVLRFEMHGTSSDLTTAIELFGAVLSLRSANHPSRSETLHHLALSLLRKFEHSKSMDDLNEVFRLYSELSESKKGVSRSDLQAAAAWAESADKFSHSSTMTAYRTALTFLVRHASIFPSSVEHYKILKNNVSSLAVDAFSYCVRHGNIKTAVEFLEQGRAVFWTHLARLGTPLNDLSSLGGDAANLADEFQRVSCRLRTLFDQASELRSTQTRKLITELDDVTSRIRTVPGFSRFLLPPEFPDLQTTAKDGPVIIMNASRYTCDAVIILHDSDPVYVKLNTSKAHLSTMVSRFRRVVDKPKLVTVKEIGTILRELWECAVEPVVQALQEHAIAPNSRIWWCPTSDFTFLPFHATGPYRTGQPSLLDLYISSYTPTLDTLLRARKHTRPLLDNPSFAVVGASEPLGETPLPLVTAELSLVAERVRDHSHVTLLANKDATIERATDTFKRCEWLHLACHGIPNETQPFDSSFALHDGHLTLNKLVQSEFQNPDFAFLSACRTTVGDATTPDEVIHLAAAMQFGGFRSVIGTVLPVDDAVAGRIVSAFYTHMLNGSSVRLDCSMAAVALHKSLKALRGKIPFDQQIVFIHIGV
jgi:CHAT domain-containing protein/tetratricopeptide (TPR) repeat protein